MAISDINLQVNVTPFPPGTCFQTDQDLADGVAAALQVIFPGTLTAWNIGSSQPSVENRDKPWLRLDAITNTITGIFSWSPVYGLWTENHWLYNGGTPPFQERRIFVGTLTNLQTYDGGEAGTVSDVTGPFWVQDTVFTDGIPVGVGAKVTVPDTTIVSNVTDGASPLNLVGVYFIKPSGRIFDRGS